MADGSEMMVHSRCHGMDAMSRYTVYIKSVCHLLMTYLNVAILNHIGILTNVTFSGANDFFHASYFCALLYGSCLHTTGHTCHLLLSMVINCLHSMKSSFIIGIYYSRFGIMCKCMA